MNGTIRLNILRNSFKSIIEHIVPDISRIIVYFAKNMSDMNKQDYKKIIEVT